MSRQNKELEAYPSAGPASLDGVGAHADEFVP